MRTITRRVAALAGAAMVWGASCGGDDTKTGSGGAGGGGSGTGGSGGASTMHSSSNAGGSGGTGGAASCIELHAGAFIRNGIGSIRATLTPNIGAPGDDIAVIQFSTDDTGTFDLSAMPDDNFMTCNQCVLLIEDAQAPMPGRLFYQASGSLNLDASSTPSKGDIKGSISDVTLVEVTIDPMSRESKPVKGGACVHVASADFEIQGAPDAWTCDPSFYAAMDGCDCNCGAPDPDCADGPQPVFGCGFDPATAVCDATGRCTPPAGWTCTQAQYSDGAACDCNCGAEDPDCEALLPTTDCTTGDVCGGTTGTCGPPVNGGETCAGATAITASGLLFGTLNAAVNDLDPTDTGCTMFAEPGGDVVYSVALAAGQTLTATVFQQADDAALYLITDCADLTTCVAGADDGVAGEPDTLTFTATTAGTYLLVVDSIDTGNMSDFSLNVTLSP